MILMRPDLRMSSSIDTSRACCISEFFADAAAASSISSFCSSGLSFSMLFLLIKMVLFCSMWRLIDSTPCTS